MCKSIVILWKIPDIYEWKCFSNQKLKMILVNIEKYIKMFKLGYYNLFFWN
jgi:hypothetical protein